MLLLVLIAHLSTLTWKACLMLRWTWEVAMAAYLSYAFACSFLPYVKSCACYCCFAVSECVTGPNAFRQFQVRDPSTCKVITRNLEKMSKWSMTRDLTGNMNLPTGWVISTQPARRFFVAYIENKEHNGMSVTVWSSGRVMDVLTSNCDPDEDAAAQNQKKGAVESVQVARMEANVAWGDTVEHKLSVGSLRPSPGSKQEKVLNAMASTVRSNNTKSTPGGTVLMVVGGSRTGKTTVGGLMLAALIKAVVLLSDFDFTDPGQWLGNILSKYGPSPESIVVIIVDECDALFEKISRPDNSSMTNLNVRTQCTDKKSLNGFLDTVRSTPGLVLVLTSNKSPTEMLEAGIVHWSSIFRTHGIHFLNEPLEKGDTRPEVDPDLPGSDLLQRAICGDVPGNWSV